MATELACNKNDFVKSFYVINPIPLFTRLFDNFSVTSSFYLNFTIFGVYFYESVYVRVLGKRSSRYGNLIRS